MFYSTEILNQRGGRFSVIWLAATKGRKLSRREVCGVNIIQTCHAILKYLKTKGVKQRLSLYLSTQLMYGTLVIYHRQHTALLDEVNSLLIQFRSLKFIHSSMELHAVPIKDKVTRSDFLTDIDFGFGEFKDAVVDIDEIPNVMVWNRDVSFEIPLQSVSSLSIQMAPSLTFSPPTSLRSKSKFESAQSFSLSGDELRLREPAPENITMFQADPDLPSFDVQGLQMIIDDQTDLSIRLPITTPDELAEPTKEQVLEQVTPKKVVPGSSVPGAPQRGARKKKDVDITVIHEESPPKRPRIIPLVLPPIESPRRKRRIRYLQIDVDISLDRKELQQNIVNTKDIVRDIQDVQVKHPLLLASTFKELFKRPARKELNNKLLFPLWARNLKQVEDFSETESDQRRPIFCVPELMLSTGSSSTPGTDQLQDISSVELPRPSSVLSQHKRSGLSERSVTPVSIKFGRSSDSLHESTPRKQRKTQSLSEEDTTQLIEQPSVHQLDEELYPLAEEIPLDFPDVSISPVKPYEVKVPEYRNLQNYIIMVVEKNTQTERWTTFRKICPPGLIKKRRAACMFYALLMAHQTCQVRIKQKEPYGDIYVRLRSTPS